jgi:hypothetical protein
MAGYLGVTNVWARTAICRYLDGGGQSRSSFFLGPYERCATRPVINFHFDIPWHGLGVQYFDKASLTPLRSVVRLVCLIRAGGGNPPREEYETRGGAERARRRWEKGRSLSWIWHHPTVFENSTGITTESVVFYKIRKNLMKFEKIQRDMSSPAEWVPSTLSLFHFPNPRFLCADG